MVGSGTTVVVARRLGHEAIGFDLDPLAVLIANVWCADLNDARILRKAAEVVDRSARWNHIAQRDAYPIRCDDETAAFIRYWFDLRARRQLRALSLNIARVRDANLRLTLWCAFSRLIVVKQAGASLAMDVAHSRPHRTYTHAPLEALAGFVPSVKKVLAGAPFKDKDAESGPLPFVGHADARAIPLPNDSVDIVITSPPYLNAIDYLRGHRMSLVWMGHALDELRAIRSVSIGAERSAAPICDKIIEAALRAALGERTLPRRQRRILTKYFQDMGRVMREITRVLRPRGRAVLVLGDCAVRGVFIKNSGAIKRLATASGLTPIASQTRPLPENRRYLPPPDHDSSGEELQKRLRNEVIVTFQNAA